MSPGPYTEENMESTKELLATPFDAVVREIIYSDNLPPSRTDGSKKDVPAYLTMLDHYLRQAQDDWVKYAGDNDALDEIRKIAAIALKCMRDCGTIYRGEL